MTYQTDVQVGDILEPGIEVETIDYDEDNQMYIFNEFHGTQQSLSKKQGCPFEIHEEVIYDHYGDGAKHKVIYYYDDGRKQFIDGTDEDKWIKSILGKQR